MTDEHSPNQPHYVSADQLRIGLYVFVDMPWFRHPFLLNSFLVNTPEQIKELRALGEKRFRYDPDRSTTGLLSTHPQAASALPAAAGEVAPRSGEEELSPLARAKQERIRHLRDHRERIEVMTKSFVKATRIMRTLNRRLTTHPEETLAQLAQLADQIVAAFLEDPEATLHVMGDRGAEDTYFHSLNVAVLSMMLARALDFTAEQARLLGTGALLHDVGLMEVPDRILKKRPEEYTKPERELRAMHCEYGLRIGRRLGLPAGVMEIIQQHHEMADGSGYPEGRKLADISPAARIVATVNVYDRLCNPDDITEAMTPHEALSFMFAQRRAKFDPRVLQLMIRSLGVYPPGTIVKLSNEVIGLVMSVNPAKPLRPWVMLYDESVPKEEAILIDLEQETDLHIANALRPALLQSSALAYLSPRQRVTYYFDSQSASGRGKE